MSSLFDRDEATLVVTDSGLGGLSVAADLVERLRTNAAFRRARVVFFNCIPSTNVGFDSMESDQRRRRVFTRALDCMATRFEPDAILLACNTISVIYESTAFAARTTVPVLGIVEMGVDLIEDHLRQQPEAQVVHFAAPTTVQSGAHKRILCERGCSADQLVYQRCDGLISAIERAPQGEATRALIDRQVADALARVPDRSLSIAASFNCTHFGYVEEAFRQAFRSQGIEPAAILDPTRRMADAFLSAARTGRFAHPEVTIEVVSQAPHAPERRQAISRLIAPRTEQTAAALMNDTCIPDLFSIE